jgi:putative ABC transport system permease protein
VSFLSLVLRNLVRQRMRTSLTVLGITIGIATVVALGVVTGGLKQTMGEILQAGGADFMVAQAGASDLSFSALSQDDWDALAARPDVAEATGVLLEVADVPGNPYFLLVGMRPEDAVTEDLAILRGRALRDPDADEVMLGEEAARSLGADVGDRVELDRRAFRVVAVYRTEDTIRAGGAVAPLRVVQQVARKPGLVTMVYVRVAPGSAPAEVAARIERDSPQYAAISDVGDISKVDQGLRIMDAVNLAISVLAVGLGAIGVMNTMIMSVFERTREIGILRAVGWTGSRVLRLVVGESLLLCLVAAALGTTLGVLASRAVLVVPAVEALLAPAYPPSVFARALAVGVVVALAGAAYPAYRAVRLSPMEALRHE